VQNSIERPVSIKEFMEIYRKKDNGLQYELIDGFVYMAPSPSTAHQSLSAFLLLKIGNFLSGKKCRVFHAPYDVYLCEDEMNTETNTVVQPDLLVVCDKNKIKSDGCYGAPDFIIEILSPSTQGRDLDVKLELYMINGVREYWIVDPMKNKIIVYTFADDKSIKGRNIFNFDESVKLSSLNNFEIDFSEFIYEY